MKLYHGSNMPIEQINLQLCMPFKDFGRGYYLTPNKDHAAEMANRKVRTYGGATYVGIFEFDQEGATKDPDIKILEFPEPNEEWAMFVLANRNRTQLQPCHNYDIVVGPIADDRVTASLNLFERNYITIQNLVQRLRFQEISIQYFFHTENSLKYLRKI